MKGTKSVWFEVWVDESIEPPYVLLIRPNPNEPKGVLVHDPKENYCIIYQGENYEAVKSWLLEDEYVLASGRVLLNE
jgi:hypothetical protein